MSITSGDTVLVNPKGRPAFEATFKLFNIFSGNYIPNGGNKTKGWYRRIMIVPFNADFNGEKEKPWIKMSFSKQGSPRICPLQSYQSRAIYSLLSNLKQLKDS